VHFHSEKNKDLQVVVGSLSLDKLEPTAQTIEVENSIVHENYRETSEGVYNDIGKASPQSSPFLIQNDLSLVSTMKDLFRITSSLYL